MNLIFHYSFLLLLPSAVLFHLWVSPFTKVEESFNIQAIHDIAQYGIPLSNVSEHLVADFDHITFTGSVPRTFIGALLLSGVSKPALGFCKNGLQAQILVRAVLGVTNAASLLALQQAISQAFGHIAGYWYVALQASQFHVIYYASRTLPNFLAFPLVTLSFRYLILAHFGSRRNKARRCQISLALVTFAGVVFRSELAILVLGMTATFVASLRLSLRYTIIPVGLATAVVGVLLSMVVDSFFWQKFPLWPELDAFLYNTVEGNASEWGTSPWYYYFTSSIPKLMLNPLSLLVCIPVALASRTTRGLSLNILMPLLIFVMIYSLLPHKEWRFIVYVIPGLTCISSVGASWVWMRRSRGPLHKLLASMLVFSIILSAFASICLVGVSSLNYPGGPALLKLQEYMKTSSPSLKVHLDNLSCQTGVTRFLQGGGKIGASQDIERSWLFDKTENTTRLGDAEFWDSFDFALAEQFTEPPGNWRRLDVIDSLQGLSFTEGTPAGHMLCQQLLPSSEKSEQMCLLIRNLENFIMQRTPGSRWLFIRMEPSIAILQKQ